MGDIWQTIVQMRMLLPFSLCFQDNHEWACCPLQILKNCVTCIAQSIATYSQQLLEFQVNVFVYYLNENPQFQMIELRHSLGLE